MCHSTAVLREGDKTDPHNKVSGYYGDGEGGERVMV